MTRILIVDQDTSVTSAFERFFGERHIDVVTASDLRQAIEGPGGVCDLILVDELPGGVTREQAVEIHERNYRTLIPVIAMTGTKLSSEQWKALGYSGYLPKPFSAAQVQESLARWLPDLARNN